MKDDELMHYGVLGMKWGVRRNASKALGKAVKKAAKLDDKVDKAQKKVDKRSAKLEKIGKRYSGFGFASRGDLAGATQKYYSAKKKLDKKIKKSEKWKNKMRESFKDVTMSSIDAEVISNGRQYVDEILNS